MRKPVTIKLDEEDLERWDAYASAHGYTRTNLIETALERFVSQTDQQAPTPTKGSESQVLGGDEDPPRTKKLDTYPSAPTDPAERREYFKWRNEQIQKMGQGARR